ncbi:aromatic prenyltransferase [Xylona heveae TC161]|uniref:Aromatic prenyltransferase n=1 Tax=Xylona heveae (strain CBS 132557 / TC161) TaxID=1328760 RepID=A0A165HTZ5_XYLHT|nr:aromatic prenyltransferase [Xylona heveae TC161]KZF23924.1 aromatic prenyltransferase [Xylona heveae TC161]
MLSDMMEIAGYSKQSQDFHRTFFTDRVARSLGPHPRASGPPKSWQSFMTDDHTPAELSWCWCSKRKIPAVRYSVEPIGQSAGSVSDPFNLFAGVQMLGNALPVSPDLDLQLYRHFSNKLLSPQQIKPSEVENGVQHPQSQTFIAFDLLEDKVVTKYYFMPSWRSSRTGKSNLETVENAIQSLDSVGIHFGNSLNLVTDFLRSFDEKEQLQVEILAIDCVDPVQSRIKIYIRSPRTSFDSAVDMLTMKGKLDPISDIASLKELWCNIFGIDDQSFDASNSLPEKGHRTSGLLYYLEIKASCPSPKTKVYLPVRHYAQDDEQVARGLSAFLEKRGKGLSNGSYYEGVSRLCKHRNLGDGLGFHTYVTCAVDGDSLAVTSYLNPETYHSSRPRGNVKA